MCVCVRGGGGGGGGGGGVIYCIKALLASNFLFYPLQYIVMCHIIQVNL